MSQNRASRDYGSCVIVSVASQGLVACRSSGGLASPTEASVVHCSADHVPATAAKHWSDADTVNTPTVCPSVCPDTIPWRQTKHVLSAMRF